MSGNLVIYLIPPRYLCKVDNFLFKIATSLFGRCCAETVASGASIDECVEQIDIGGPSMVRVAAKNHPSVAVVVDAADYASVVEAIAAGATHLRIGSAITGPRPAHG